MIVNSHSIQSDDDDDDVVEILNDDEDDYEEPEEVVSKKAKSRAAVLKFVFPSSINSYIYLSLFLYPVKQLRKRHLRGRRL
jgi:hypothetical protein